MNSVHGRRGRQRRSYQDADSRCIVLDGAKMPALNFVCTTADGVDLLLSISWLHVLFFRRIFPYVTFGKVGVSVTFALSNVQLCCL